MKLFCTLLLSYHLTLHVKISNTLSRSEQLSNTLKKKKQQAFNMRGRCVKGPDGTLWIIDFLFPSCPEGAPFEQHHYLHND